MNVSPCISLWCNILRIYICVYHLQICVQEYCNLYLKSVGAMSESGETPKSVHIKCGDRWEIVVAVSDGQFQQVSIYIFMSFIYLCEYL